MSTLHASTTLKTKTAYTERAALVYEYTHISASSLLSGCDAARTARGKPRGALTDAEQDILRAMLVMAAAGLDAMFKQLIRDSMSALVAKDGRVRSGLEKFVQKQVRGEPDSPDLTVGAKFIARILASATTQSAVIEAYIGDLTGDSLQSADQVMKTLAALGVDQAIADPKSLRPIFEIRNIIIHEMDMDLEGKRRKRNQRGIDDMIGFVDCLLVCGGKTIEAVDAKLK